METSTPLIFVDTNILLDAYRKHNDIVVSLVERLYNDQEHIISTYQVEMEFKKNRQATMLESRQTLKAMETDVTIPAFLSDTKKSKIIGNRIKDTRSRAGALREKLESILANPITHDRVYQIVQKLFSRKSDLHLSRDDNKMRLIRRKAWERFILGYPPRKKNDTSIGDSINWEWIIDCATRTSKDVIIVSRDADYGCSIKSDYYPNDWLLQEFKERTKKARKLKLTNRLGDALDALKIKVSKEEKDEEIKAIERTKREEESESAM